MSKKRKFSTMKTNDNSYVQGDKTKQMHGRTETAYYRQIYKKLDNALMTEEKAEKKAAAKEAKKS